MKDLFCFLLFTTVGIYITFHHIWGTFSLFTNKVTHIPTVGITTINQLLTNNS